MKHTTLPQASLRHEFNGECEFYSLGICKIVEGAKCLHSGVKQECGMYYHGRRKEERSLSLGESLETRRDTQGKKIYNENTPAVLDNHADIHSPQNKTLNERPIHNRTLQGRSVDADRDKTADTFSGHHKTFSERYGVGSYGELMEAEGK